MSSGFTALIEEVLKIEEFFFDSWHSFLNKLVLFSATDWFVSKPLFIWFTPVSLSSRNTFCDDRASSKVEKSKNAHPEINLYFHYFLIWLFLFLIIIFDYIFNIFIIILIFFCYFLFFCILNFFFYETSLINFFWFIFPFKCLKTYIIFSRIMDWTESKFWSKIHLSTCLMLKQSDKPRIFLLFHLRISYEKWNDFGATKFLFFSFSTLAKHFTPLK